MALTFPVFNNDKLVIEIPIRCDNSVKDIFFFAISTSKFIRIFMLLMLGLRFTNVNYYFMLIVKNFMQNREHPGVVSGFDAWPNGDLPVLVASHRPIPCAPKSVQQIQGDMKSMIAMAKEKANGKGDYLDGGSMPRQGLNAGRVDQMTLTYLPILLGNGTRLFDVLNQSRLLQFTSIAASGKGYVQVSCRTRS